MSPLSLLSLPAGTVKPSQLGAATASPQGERAERSLALWGVSLVGFVIGCVFLLS